MKNRAMWTMTVLAAIGVGCDTRRPIRVEPQVGPADPATVRFHPKEEHRLLVVDTAGAFSLWDVSEGGNPKRVWSVAAAPRDCRFSGDGSYVVTAGPKGKLRAHRSSDGSVGWEVTEPDYVTSLATSPDGKLVAVGDVEGTIRLVSASDGAAFGQAVKGHEKPVFLLEFFPDGKILLSADRLGSVKLWKVGDSLRVHPVTIPKHAALPEVGFVSGELVTFSIFDGLRRWNSEGSSSTLPFPPWVLPRVLATSSRGDILAVGGVEGMIRLLKPDGTPSSPPIFGHTKFLRSLSFSAEGGLLASASEDGTVGLWNLKPSPLGPPLSGRENRLGYSPAFVCFSPRGDFLATAAWADLRLWKLAGAPRVQWMTNEFEFRDEKGKMRESPGFFGVAFSGTGDFWLTAGQDGNLRLWNLDGSPRGMPLQAHSAMVQALAVSPSGERWASGAKDGTVRLWKADGKPFTEPIEAHAKGVTSVAFSAKEELWASTGNDGRVRLWNWDGAQRGEGSAHAKAGTAVAFSPKGDILLSAGEDGTIDLLEPSGLLRKKIPNAHGSDVVRSVAFSPRGDLWASGGDDTRVRLWSPDGVAWGKPMMHPGWRVSAVAFSPQGDLLASACDRGWIQLWQLDPSTWGTLPKSLNQRVGHAVTVTISPRGDLLVAGSADGMIRIWNLDGTPRTEPIKAHEGRVKWVAFSPNGDWFVSAGSDAKVLRWAEDGTQLGELLGGALGLGEYIVVSPQGDVIAATGSNDSAIQLWNPDGTSRAERFAGETGHFHQPVAFSRKGDLLATPGGLGTGSVQVWKKDGDPHCKLLKVSRSEVSALAFSPLGDLLVMGDSLGEIHVRKLDGSPAPEREQMPFFALHSDLVKSLAFSPAGHLFASAGSDGIVQLWKWDGRNLSERRDLETGEPMRRVGFVGNSVWAHAESGRVYFADLQMRLKAEMFVTSDGILARTPGGWYSGEGDLFRSARVYRGDQNLSGGAELSSWISPPDVKEATTGERPWGRLVASALTEVSVWVEGCYGQLPLWARPIFWSVLPFLVVVLSIVIVWVVRPATVARWAMPDVKVPEPPAWKVWLDVVSLIRLLGNTQRSLDAWLRAHAQELYSRRFAERPSVVQRWDPKHYLDLSDKADATWRDAVAGGAEAAFWVTGPGGAGKSTLAFQMMAMSLALTPGHPVLPVLVDVDWEKDKLIDVVADLLRVGSRRPTPATVRKLGHTGRLVLLVDGLSERRVRGATDVTPADQLADLFRSGAFRHLLVTSRDEPPADGPFKTISVGPLEGPRLAEFVRVYYQGPNLEEVESALDEWRRGEPVRPLFARRAIERLASGHPLPDSWPQLVVDYVAALRPTGKGALDPESFLRAARLTAYACVEENLASQIVAEDALGTRLREDGDRTPFMGVEGVEVGWQAVLKQMVVCGLIERRERLSYGQYQFGEDPIAEYLAAIYAIGLDNGRVLAGIRRRRAFPGSGFAEVLSRVEHSLAGERDEDNGGQLGQESDVMP